MGNKQYDKRWNFQEGSMDELNHQIHSYPAMLMPLIAREILKKYGKGKGTNILDPYVGSGTTLVEAMKYGVNKVVGIDLNPLALLISKVKTTKYDFKKLEQQIEDFKNYSSKVQINPTINDEETYNFALRNSWFKEKNINELDTIKKYIDKLSNESIKNYFNIAFSQTVRIVSMTRNGEFKLYRIPKNKIDDFNPDAFQEFNKLLMSNIVKMKVASSQLDYSTEVEIKKLNTMNLINEKKYKKFFDLVITSPPYGDSHTTVAYGQFSRLANEWLGFEEAQKLDRSLLGGDTKVDHETFFDIEELDDVISKIKEIDRTNKNKRYPDVISFYLDYIESIKSVSSTIKANGYAIYIVGNRRVRNYELPTDIITIKAFEKYGFIHEQTIVRDILNKRMPSKASPSNRIGGQITTMMKEYIVIMKKVR